MSMRSPHELLPGRKRLIALFMVFAIFGVSMPLQVAADLARPGSAGDRLNAALVAAAAVVSGIVVLVLLRWLERLRDALNRTERRSQ